MNSAERGRDDALHEFWRIAADHPDATPPEGVDPLAGAMLRGLRELRPPDPDPAFVARLAAELHRRAAECPRAEHHVLASLHAAQTPNTERRTANPKRRPLLAGLATAAVLLVAALGYQAFLAPGGTASATAILQKAEATAAGTARFTSFAITETSEVRPATLAGNDDIVRTEITRWYEAPGRWRREVVSTVIGADGVEKSRGGLVSVSDGATLWIHRLRDNTVIIRPTSATDDTELGPFPEVTGGLSGLLAQAGACYTPRVAGTETIAGRAAYTITLGRSRCAPAADAGVAAVGAEPAEWTVWVDKETFLILKSVQEIDGTPVATSTVTAVQYNVPGDASRFRFTPPAGAKLRDTRP